MKNQSIKLLTLIKFIIFAAFVYCVYTAGVNAEANRIAQRAFNRMDAQIQASRYDWAQKQHDSIFKLVADKAMETLNTF